MSRTRKPKTHPSEYLIPASDSKGHSTLYQFRAPESWGRRMEEVIQSRIFPFGTPSEIMRWCWFEGMELLARLEPKCTDLSQVVAAQRVVREAEDQQRFLSIFERAGRVIDSAVEDHDEGRARQLIADLRYLFEQMPEGPSREKYLARLSRWDWLLKKATTAPITQLSEPRRRRPQPVAEEEEV